MLCVMCCLVFGDCCVLLVVFSCAMCCSLFMVRWALCGVYWLLCAGSCSLCVNLCWLHYLFLSVVCDVLFGVCCVECGFVVWFVVLLRFVCSLLLVVWVFGAC